jgi:polyphosphate kinase
MADVNRMFTFIEKWKDGMQILKSCTTLIPCPTDLRKELTRLINKEIRNAHNKKPAMISLKMNSLSDEELIDKLYEAAKAGVKVRLIIRGIFCMFSENKKFVHPVKAVSIVDEYLEHARVFIFHNGGNEKVYISSADWMVRNLDHRLEATLPIKNQKIKKVLMDLFDIQLNDNVKARILDNQLSNQYLRIPPGLKLRGANELPKNIRSQEEIYNYLQQFNEPVKSKITHEVGSN